MTSARAGFAARLREATTPDHAEAESSGFLDRLLGDAVDLHAYRLLAAQHLALYDALETAMRARAGHPVIAPFHDERLERVPALEADLAWLRDRLGPGGEEVLPATEAYVDRIRGVAATWPAGLVAHHYTRYLGDLSGGVHIGRVLARQLGGGTGFYRFEAIEDPKRWKDAYRARLDAAPWDEAEQARIVAEVSRAYACNRALLADLERHRAAMSSAATSPR